MAKESEDMKMQSVRISKRRLRRIKKKRNRLTWQVMHSHCEHNVCYYLLLCLAFLLDMICGIFALVCKLLCVGLVCGCLFGFLFYHHALPMLTPYYSEAGKIAKDSTDNDFHINEGSIIYDNKGEVLANLYETSFNTYLSYNEIPKNVVNAFVAIEDRTFWENNGVDYKGIIRVGLRYVLSRGNEAHGASTITQQLARSIYLTRDVTMSRKLTEIFLAQDLTKKYSKEKIMEFYVNTCNYGNGIYGIEGASQAYFNKPSSELTLAEAAYLAAIPNRPSYYNPWNDMSNAVPRQQKILHDMLQVGSITTAEYEEALKQKIVLQDKDYVYNDYLSSYAIDCSVRYLMELDNYAFRYKFDDMDDFNAYQKQYADDYTVYKQKLYTGGYRIYTSLDKTVYDNLQSIFDNVLSSYNNETTDDGMYACQGALTVIDNQTHKVIAVVGGRTQNTDSKVYSFNRAYQAYRQPGSSIKPVVVYTPALANGWTPDTIVHNIDVSVAKKPGVDAQSLSGASMTLRSAVEQSKNGVAWQIFDELGPKTGLSYLQKQQFSQICPSDYNDAAALGGLTYGVNTVEMASAYETISNNGTYYAPTCIVSFLNKDGKEIFEDVKGKENVYNADATRQMRDICSGVLTVGTARKLNWTGESDMPAFAKTGTTNSNKDIWFCGSTPYYSIASYVGFDTPREMAGVYGSSYSGEIWKQSMLYLTNDKMIKDFD